MAGVDSWTGADGRPDPCVIANNNDHPVSFSTLTIPAKTIAMHPGPSTGVAVGWTSPLTGSVQIRGGVVDGDPNCGDGIDWRIEHAAREYPRNRRQRVVSKRGHAGIRSRRRRGRLESVDVRAGDVVQLTIFPKENYSCDTTIVKLEIAQRDGRARRLEPEPGGSARSGRIQPASGRRAIPRRGSSSKPGRKGDAFGHARIAFGKVAGRDVGS